MGMEPETLCKLFTWTLEAIFYNILKVTFREKLSESGATEVKKSEEK